MVMDKEKESNEEESISSSDSLQPEDSNDVERFSEDSWGNISPSPEMAEEVVATHMRESLFL